jgi:hypothetical protein
MIEQQVSNIEPLIELVIDRKLYMSEEAFIEFGVIQETLAEVNKKIDYHLRGVKPWRKKLILWLMES